MSSIFLTIDEAAIFLRTTRSYLYQLVHRRKIPFFKPLNGKLLFDQQDLEKFVRKSRVSTSIESDERATALLNGARK